MTIESPTVAGATYHFPAGSDPSALLDAEMRILNASGWNVGSPQYPQVIEYSDGNYYATANVWAYSDLGRIHVTISYADAPGPWDPASATSPVELTITMYPK